jgi:hypothetical protein
LTARPARCAIEAEIGDKLRELAVLVLELLQPTQLAGAEPAIQLPPAVERLLRNPLRRMTSATGVPVSACFSAKAICSSVNLLFFTAPFLP